MINLRHPARLYALAQKLHFGLGSTANLFGSYYFGSRAVLKKFFPKTVVLDLKDFGKMPIRTNAYDFRLLEQIFVQHDYHLEADGVSRILDLGSNIGMSTLYFHRLFPEAEIACVEPSPLNTPLLERTLSLNNIRGRVFKGAVGPEDGTIDLNISDQPDRNSILPVDNASNTVTVPLISVPEIMRQMGWDKIDLLKIDIEGAEKHLLGNNNSWLNDVRIIIGEGHMHVDYSYAQLQADLKPFGFVCKTLIPETKDAGATFLAQRPS